MVEEEDDEDELKEKESGLGWDAEEKRLGEGAAAKDIGEELEFENPKDGKSEVRDEEEEEEGGAPKEGNSDEGNSEEEEEEEKENPPKERKGKGDEEGEEEEEKRDRDDGVVEEWIGDEEGWEKGEAEEKDVCGNENGWDVEEEEAAELVKEKPDMFTEKKRKGMGEGLYDSFLRDAPSSYTCSCFYLIDQLLLVPRDSRLQVGRVFAEERGKNRAGPIEFRAPRPVRVDLPREFFFFFFKL